MRCVASIAFVDWTEGRTWQEKEVQDKTRQDKTGQDETRQDKTGQDKTIQGKRETPKIR